MAKSRDDQDPKKKHPNTEPPAPADDFVEEVVELPAEPGEAPPPDLLHEDEATFDFTDPKGSSASKGGPKSGTDQPIEVERVMDEDLVDFSAVPDLPPSPPPAARPAKPASQARAEESVEFFDDDIVDFSSVPPGDADKVSGVFSEVMRPSPDSAVNPGASGVVRGVPLSESTQFESLSDAAPHKPDSDIRVSEHAEPAGPKKPDSDIVELGEEAVFEAEAVPGGSDIVALPESAVVEDVSTPKAGESIPAGKAPQEDSSVKLESVPPPRTPPEKEVVLDLEETLGSVDSPVPHKPQDQTIAFQTAKTEGDIDITDLVDDEVDLGAEARLPGQSGIDPLAEELESGVRLDGEEAPSGSPSVPMSVEFDDLVTEEDESSAVELGTLKPKKPKAGKTSARLPQLPQDNLADATAEEKAIDIDDLVSEPISAGPRSGVDEDDIASQLLSDDLPASPTDDSGPGLLVKPDDESELEPEPVMEIDEPFEEPEKPAKTERRKAVETEAAAEPFAEPRKAGWGGVLGGTAVGLLLAIGALGGVWYFAPNLLPESPNAVKAPPVEKLVAKPSPVQLAEEHLQAGRFDEALAAVQEAPEDNKTQVAVRGEARWLRYLHKQSAAKAPLQKDDQEVKLALEDFRKSGSDIRLEQAQAVLEGKKLQTEADQLRKSEEMLREEVKRVTEEKEKSEKVVDGLTKILADAQLLDAKEKLDPAAAQKIIKDLAGAKAALALIGKSLEEAKVDSVDKLLAAKKDADDKLAAVDKLLQEEKVKAPGAKGLQELVAQRDQIAKEREDLAQTIQAAAKELAAGELIPADADPRKSLVEGARAARVKSESPLGGPLGSLAGGFGKMSLGVGALIKNAYEDAALVGELNYYRLRDAFVPTPEQQLDRLLALLQSRDETNVKTLGEAERLAAFVLSKEAKTSDAARAKAQYVQGLALRNQGKYAEARKAFAQAQTAAKDSTEPWAALVRRSHAEITDPTAYYLPRIDRLRQEDDLTGALKEVDAALKVLNNDPVLLAQRGLLKLDAARGKADAKVLQAVRSDAEAALKNPKTASTGAFVLGRLEESSGDPAGLEKAEKLYRQALQGVKDDERKAADIRLALGRLLLKEANAAASEPAPKEEKKEIEEKAPAKKDAPADEKKDPKDDGKEPKDGGVEGPELGAVHPLTQLLAALAIQQVPLDDEEDPAAKARTEARVKESLELAKQLIQSKDQKIRAQGYLLMGEALTRMGQRTEGLKQYGKGLELINPSARVSQMIDEHPAFQVPDALARANPLLAERHYGAGLHLFHEKRYADAEAQFRQAIAYFDKDARYFYFLGLAQLEQRTRVKRDAAYYSWEQASRLEANSRPRPDEVNLALERVQGPRRTLLDSYRSKTIINP